MDLITFRYFGGSSPGQQRTLWTKQNLATRPTALTFEGLDVDEMEFRRFTTSKMRDAQSVPFNSIDPGSLPYDAKQVVFAFKQKGKCAFIDSATGNIISYNEPKLPKISIRRDTNDTRHRAIAFVNSDGRRVVIRHHSSEDKIILERMGHPDIHNPTFEQFQEALATLQ